MNLLEITGTNVLKITPQALSLKPFAEIWERDKTKTKDIATAELSYIWFMEDIQSPFSIILEESDRISEIKKVLSGVPHSWKEDKVVSTARELYKKLHRSIAIDMLENTQRLLIKANEFISEVDLQETYKDKQGNIKFKFDFDKVVQTASKIPSLLESLKKVQELAKADITLKSTEMRGTQAKSLFEDGV